MARLEESEAEIARLRAQSEAHRKLFSTEVEVITENYMKIQGRLSDDAVELFAVCRKLMSELLDDSLLVGEATGKRAEVAALLKRIELEGSST